LLAGCVAVTARASTLNTAQIGIDPNFSGGSGPYDDLSSVDGPTSLAGSATGGFDSSGSGSIHVEWGVIEAEGEAAGSLNAVTRGIFRDAITITAPGVAAGTPGTLSYSIIVDGALATNDIGSDRAGWSLQADVGGGSFDIDRGGTLYGGGIYAVQHGYLGDPFGSYSATVGFQFGIASPLEVELSSSAQAAYSFDDGLPAASFLAHSLYWGGIGAVAISGVPLDDFSVASASGTDYRGSMAPVPEPGRVWLMLAGLAVFGLRRRLRREPG
jgi:hypothetical protein